MNYENKILSEIISKMPLSDFKDSTVRNLLLGFSTLFWLVRWTVKWKSFKQLLRNKTWRQPWVRWSGGIRSFFQNSLIFFFSWIRACETGAICSDGEPCSGEQSEILQTQSRRHVESADLLSSYSWQQKITKMWVLFSPKQQNKSTFRLLRLELKL